eukprot:TRINITY_DN31182_c0_g1_i1.p1 TRINITY_DN31182_c0_g1~~TRINITY_DN31182_c0_g1_i1.p1  ORF type:complete len:140 (-),score=35.89 TRINITY_DN31182_c0_g1_i1:75-494(-)
MLQASGLVPARFLTLISHLVLTLTVLMAREDNVLACLPLDHTQVEFARKDTELAAGLGVAIGLMAIEMVGFLSGLSMFSPVQSLLSIALHASATVSMAYLILDVWDCGLFWWIFGLCSCFPAVVELTIMVGVLGLKKPV